jgi:hypothetical protein
LLQKAAIAPIKVQEQIAQMLDSITCTITPPDIYKWYNDVISLIKPGEKRPRAADIGVPDASLYYTDFVDIAMKKSVWLGIHGHGFSRKKGKKGKFMSCLVFKSGLHTIPKIGVCPGADNQGPLLITTNSTQKLPNLRRTLA